MDQAYSLYGFISWLLPAGTFMSVMAMLTNLPWPFIIVLGLGLYGIGLGISNQRLWRKNIKEKEQAKPVKQERQIVTQTEEDMVDDIINTIRNDLWIDRLFRDLIFGRKVGSYERAPAIVSGWRPDNEGNFYYIGKNKKPTIDEEKEKAALAWLVSKGLARPAQDPTTDEDDHWYLMEQIGIARKVKEKYQREHPHEKR